jgi:hypothetical protein
MIATDCDGTVVVSPTNQTLKYNQWTSKSKAADFSAEFSLPTKSSCASVSVRPRKLGGGGGWTGGRAAHEGVEGWTSKW